MKTIYRTFLMLGMFVSFLSADSFAQSSLAELQTLENTLNTEIASAQASITAQQNLLSAAATDLQAATDEGDADLETALISRQSDLNASISNLQATLGQLQADLADVQSKMVAVQNQANLLDKNWVLANMPPSPPTTDPRILGIPDINNPSTLNTLIVSTGNAQADAEIIYQWLVANGLAK